MIDNLKSETRKLLTIRSTYLLSAAVMLLVIFIGGYITGYRAEAAVLKDPLYLVEQVFGAIGAMSILVAIPCLLIFGHEYRNNTIIYTLTLTKSRSAVLASKILVTTLYALLMGAIIVALTIISTIIGIKLHGLHLVPQAINYGQLFWQSLFVVWGFAMLGLLIIALFRNLILSVVLLLLMPTTIEGILSLLLKDNAQYLPFTSLLKVVTLTNEHMVNNFHAVITALAYIVVGWVIAWILFLKRDAN